MRQRAYSGGGRVTRSARRVDAPERRRASRSPAKRARSKTATKRAAKRTVLRATDRGTDAAVEAELDAAEHDGRDAHLTLGRGVTLSLSSLDKVWFPGRAGGYTKGDVLRHYVRVAPFILPVMADRPLVLKRFPDGINGETFYQQKAPANPPAGVRVETIEDAGRRSRRPTRRWLAGDAAVSGAARDDLGGPLARARQEPRTSRTTPSSISIRARARSSSASSRLRRG